MHYETVLKFWFETTPKDMHFKSSPEFDAKIKDMFEIHLYNIHLFYESWLTTCDGALALIILTDQFPRNMYRGTKNAFYYDAYALDVCKYILNLSDSKAFCFTHLDAYRKMFLILPLMHSEDFDDQVMSLKLFSIHGPKMAIPYAQNHHDVIKKFGRFPHRNEALQRKSNFEEEYFIYHNPEWPQLN